jgi:hypothetical protein
MVVRIGVLHAPRELVVDTDETAEAVEKRLNEAVAAGAAFTLVDSKGRRVLVPAAHVAYIEMGGGVSGTVGFRS